MKSALDNLCVQALCDNLHAICSTGEKFCYPFNFTKIPSNGLYIMFQKGETAHGYERIVRIGTHVGDNQLASRIKQHFIKENKDRSIFRKNVGRALLKARNDDYLNIWELDNTSRKSHNNNLKTRDLDFELLLEKEITNYLRENISMCFVRTDDKNKRLSLESKIASTVSLCKQCEPSKQWLGSFNPKEKIRDSGLWQVNELYKIPLENDDLDYIKNNIVLC